MRWLPVAVIVSMQVLVAWVIGTQDDDWTVLSGMGVEVFLACCLALGLYTMEQPVD